MSKRSFIGVLSDNVKCAVCDIKNCPVRYYPGRKVTISHGGARLTIGCLKEASEKIERRKK